MTKLTLRDKLNKFINFIKDAWRSFIEWNRQIPYMDFIIESFINYILWLIAWAIISIFFILSSLFIFLKQPQIASAIIALFGTILVICIQGLINISNSRKDLRKQSLQKMLDEYETMINILRIKENLSIEEINSFLIRFDKRIYVYGATNIIYRWQKVKKLIPRLISGRLEKESKDLRTISNFISSLRIELGHISNSTIMSHIHRDLKSSYHIRNKRKDCSIDTFIEN